MKLAATYSHHKGASVWKDRDLYEWITDLFEVPSLTVTARATGTVREHVRKELEKEGWAFNVRIDSEADLTVFSKKDDLVVQLQTGNISRYVYDLLKIQHLYSKKEIEAAALAVPTKAAAERLGSNITNCDRVWNELNIFSRVITVPIMVISFE